MHIHNHTPVVIEVNLPRTLSEDSQNEIIPSGHSHEVEKASTSRAGIVKLNDTLVSLSKVEALTANQGRELAERIEEVLSASEVGAINKTLDAALAILATRYTSAYATYQTARDNVARHPENALIYIVNDPQMSFNGLWTVEGGRLVKAPWDALSSALTSEPFEVLQAIFQGAAGEKIVYEGKTYDTLATFTQTLAEGKAYIQTVLADLAQSNNFTASYLLTASGKFQQEINDSIGAKWYSKPNGYALNDRVMLSNGDIVKSTIDGNVNDPNVGMTGWALETIRSVPTPTNLSSINSPKHRQRVYVDSLQKNFVYDSNLTTPENGVTVVGKWEMEVQEAYYASWFASSDIQIAQDENLQASLNYATSKNRPLIIDAKFWVDAHRVHSNNPLYGALIPKSNSKIIFTPGSSINVIAGSATNYNVIACARSVDNIHIINPKLIGDRIQHTYIGGTHEWGYGLVIYESSNVYVANLDCSNMTGDGLYIGKEWGTALKQVPTNIVVSNVNIDRVRRNGISFTAGNNVKILNPTVNNIGTFDGIAGVAPASGIDIEPEEPLASWDAGARAYIRNSAVHNLIMNSCDGGLTMGLFNDGRECSLNFTGLTVANNSKPFVIYNAVGTPTATSSQSGTIFIENYLVTGAMSESVSDIGMREYGINVIVNKLTFTKGISRVTHHLTPIGTVLNEFTKPFGGMVFNEIVTENSDVTFNIGRYYLGTDAMRQQSRPNYKYFWKTPPKIPISYDYDFAKPYGDNYRNNAVTTGPTNEYFNLSLMGGDTVIMDASVPEPAVSNPQKGRKMRIVLGFGVTNFGVIAGLGTDTVLVKQDGSIVRIGTLKLSGGGSWVELLKISDTQTQILGSYGNLQAY